MPVQKKIVSKDEALARLQRYCAFQERCLREVRIKLLNLGIPGNDLEEIITALVEAGYLDEARFARSFVRGSYRFKHWGRVRIIRELKMRGISDHCIRMGLEEIGEEEYRQALILSLKKKSAQLAAEEDFIRKNKLAQHAIQRGFEADLVWSLVGTPELE